MPGRYGRYKNKTNKNKARCKNKNACRRKGYRLSKRPTDTKCCAKRKKRRSRSRNRRRSRSRSRSRSRRRYRTQGRKNELTRDRRRVYERGGKTKASGQTRGDIVLSKKGTYVSKAKSNAGKNSPYMLFFKHLYETDAAFRALSFGARGKEAGKRWRAR